MNKEEKKKKVLEKTVRYDVDISKNIEFSYRDLVMGHDLDELPRYERQQFDDHVDKGSGYDLKDPFIDNDEAYDELVPSTITTKYGGFYVNTGKLEFRPLTREEMGQPQTVVQKSTSNTKSHTQSQYSGSGKTTVNILSAKQQPSSTKSSQAIIQQSSKQKQAENKRVSQQTGSVPAVVNQQQQKSDQLKQIVKQQLTEQQKTQLHQQTKLQQNTVPKQQQSSTPVNVRQQQQQVLQHAQKTQSRVELVRPAGSKVLGVGPVNKATGAKGQANQHLQTPNLSPAALSTTVTTSASSSSAGVQQPPQISLPPRPPPAHSSNHSRPPQQYDISQLLNSSPQLNLLALFYQQHQRYSQARK